MSDDTKPKFDVCPQFKPGPWKFTGETGFDKGAKTCGYCGSLHPDIFMKRVDEGTLKMTATDKNYKVYVNSVDDSEGLESVKFYWPHLSEAQQKQFITWMNTPDKLNFGPSGIGFYVLPYFVSAS